MPFADVFPHVAGVVHHGAGLPVPLDQLTAASLARLTGDPALRSAAQEVAAEIAAMPHPRELVGPLAQPAGQPIAS